MFLIAADTARIDSDIRSPELVLKVALVLQGERTGLNRFGYQVGAVVTTQATGNSGTIRWRRAVFDGANRTLEQIAQSGSTARRLADDLLCKAEAFVGHGALPGDVFVRHVSRNSV